MCESVDLAHDYPLIRDFARQNKVCSKYIRFSEELKNEFIDLVKKIKDMKVVYKLLKEAYGKKICKKFRDKYANDIVFYMMDPDILNDGMDLLDNGAPIKEVAKKLKVWTRPLQNYFKQRKLNIAEIEMTDDFGVFFDSFDIFE